MSTLFQPDDPPDDRILAFVAESPEGRMTDEIALHMGRTAQQLGDVFERMREEGRLLGFAGQWITPEGFETVAQRLLRALGEGHARRPALPMLPREPVARAAGLGWSGKPLDRLVARLVERGDLAAEGEGIRLVAFRPRLPARQRSLLDRILAELSKEAIDVPSAGEIARALNVPLQAVEQLFGVAVEAGEVVDLGEGIRYTPAQLGEAGERLRTIGRPFTAAEARDFLGTSRKYIIPLLEWADRSGLTVREGDLREIVEEQGVSPSRCVNAP